MRIVSRLRKHLTVLRDGHRFGFNVGRLAAGTAAAQVVSLVLTPILSRIYQPGDFGVLAVFMSIVGIASVVAALRYELAIPLPRHEKNAQVLLVAALLMSLGMSLLMLIGALTVGDRITGLFGVNGSVDSAIILIPLAVFSGAIFNILTMGAIRRAAYRQLNRARVVTTSSILAIQLLIAPVLRHSAIGLILGQLIGSWIGTGLLFYGVFRKYGDWRIDRFAPRLKRALSRYRKFPLINTWSSLLNQASWQIPALLLATWFAPSVVGFYALSFRVIKVPMSLLGRAVAHVFLQEAATADASRLRGMTLSVIDRFTLVGFLPFLSLVITGPELFVTVFGLPWREAGVYTQMMAIWMFVWLISSPLTSLYTVLELQERLLVFNVLLLATRIGSLWIGGLVMEPRLSIALFSVTGIILYGWLCLSVVATAGVPIGSLVRVVAFRLLRMSPFAVPMLFARFTMISSFAVTAVSVGSCAAYYLVVAASPRFRSSVHGVKSTI